MARVTVTIEGDAEEIRDALIALLGQGLPQPVERPAEAAPERAAPAPVESPWTSSDVAILWDGLTPDARQILAEIATQPDGYPITALTERVGVDMRRIGGRLSSVGHNMRRYFGEGDAYRKPWPLTNDGARRQYTMRPEVAEAIVSLVDAEG